MAAVAYFAWQYTTNPAFRDAVTDLARDITQTAADILYAKGNRAPTPSGNWPPTPSDLGITEPGTPGGPPNLPPNLKKWWWIPIGAGIVEQILEPYLDDFMENQGAEKNV